MKSQGRIGGEIQLGKPQTLHIFSLSSINPDAKNKFDIELDFSCCSMETQSLGDNNVDTTSSMSNLPIFNFDGNVTTPAFIYKREKSLFQQNIHNYNQCLLPHTQKNIEQFQPIMIPKPKSQYCGVCKTHFSDYLNHIKRQDHIQKLRWFNKKNKIDDLISQFQKNKKRNEKRRSILHQIQVVQRKKKVRIIDDPSVYSPVSIISKNVSETPTNNLSMQKQNFKKFNSERILQY